MSGSDSEVARDPENQAGTVQPGGAATRGPNPSPGGKVDAEVEGGTYQDRTEKTDAKDERSEGVSRAMTGKNAPQDTNRPGQVGPTGGGGAQQAPSGVGVSTGTRGEDVGDKEGQERGRQGSGDEGAGRPTGTSDRGDETGVG